MIKKLVKTESTYHLVVNNKIIASVGDSDGKLQKLSLKNCEIVRSGYDLDELVEDNFKGLRDCIVDKDIAEFYISLVKTTVTEILGDKKFSEEDVLNLLDKRQKDVFEYWSHRHFKHLSTNKEWLMTQSLQQTERDCTFNPDEKDVDGCLILKLKKDEN